MAPLPRLVVVGAGPAGTALALQLARAGWPVDLVEGQRGHTARPRGDGLMPSGLEALRRLQLDGILERVPRRPLRAWSFVIDGRTVFSVAEPIAGGEPCALIDTPGLLEGMLHRATACPSLRFWQGRAVKALRLSARDGVNGAGRVSGVVLEDGTGLQADLVVACDGRDSSLRRQAGLDLREEASGLEVLWFELEGEAAAHLRPWIEERFVSVLGDRGSYALFGTARAGVRLGWLQERGAALGRELPWTERLAACSPPELAGLWRSLPGGALTAAQRFPIKAGLASPWSRPGLLLLGDAAHPMSPLRAQGLNMALRDAVVAAEILLDARRGLDPGSSEGLAALDQTVERVVQTRLPEIRAVQALQRQELARAELLRQRPWLRQLLAATAPWSGPLLSRRWQAGQPTLRHGLPWPAAPG